MRPDRLDRRHHVANDVRVADRGYRHLHALLDGQRLGARAALRLGSGDAIRREDSIH
jgi:hypothetical protein